MPYQVISIIGGAYQNAETTRSPSYIVVESAHIHQIAGGGTADMGNADMPLGTNIAVRGNAEVDFIYGGGASTGNLYGNSKILVEGGSVGAVFGGGLVKAGVLNYKGIKTDGDVEVDISGGHVNYVEAGPANGSNITIDANGFITSVTDAFYGGIITGKADVNISAVNGASYVYGDVFRNYGNQVGTVGADSMRRVKGLTTLNVSASNHFAEGFKDFTVTKVTVGGVEISNTAYTVNTQKFDFDVSSAAINIVNISGTQLPSTGGIGTTLFYVVGALLMVSAFVLLITKKRMNTEK